MLPRGNRWSRCAATVGLPFEDVPVESLRVDSGPALDDLRLHLQELHLDAFLHTGRFDQAYSRLRELMASRPMHEPFHERAMIALYGARRRGDALESYGNARRMLRDELGADPSPVLRNLHRRILPDAGDQPGRVDAADRLRRRRTGRPVRADRERRPPSLADIRPEDYAALLVIGGQAPMYTFAHDERVHALIAAFHESGRVTAVLCHGTAALLKTRLSDGSLLVTGKRWTGFANSEEDFVDSYVGQRVQPFRIEDEARGLPDTEFTVRGQLEPHAVRDGLLITGQQQ